MADDFSARLRKAGETARQEASSQRSQERMDRGTPVSRSEIWEAFAALQENMAVLAERIEALERGR